MTALVMYRSFAIDPEAGLIIGRGGRPIGSRTYDGYVSVGRPKRGIPTTPAHRLIWEAVHGPIPEGLQINHKNGVKHDSRIGNLELATPSENIQHAFRMGLACNRGERAPHRRLSKEQVIEIRRLFAQGVSQTQLAKQFGVCRRNVGKIVYRQSWTDI